MAWLRALARSAFAAWGPLSPVFDIRAAMSPATSGVANDVPLQRAMPWKSRGSPAFGGSVQMSCREGVDQTLARRVDVHPRSVVGEPGLALLADVERTNADRPRIGGRPER